MILVFFWGKGGGDSSIQIFSLVSRKAKELWLKTLIFKQRLFSSLKYKVSFISEKEKSLYPPQNQLCGILIFMCSRWMAGSRDMVYVGGVIISPPSSLSRRIFRTCGYYRESKFSHGEAAKKVLYLMARPIVVNYTLQALFITHVPNLPT